MLSAYIAFGPYCPGGKSANLPYFHRYPYPPVGGQSRTLYTDEFGQLPSSRRSWGCDSDDDDYYDYPDYDDYGYGDDDDDDDGYGYGYWDSDWSEGWEVDSDSSDFF